MIRQFPPTSSAGYSGSSTTLIGIGLGEKIFITQTGMAFVIGQRCTAIHDATNYMEGIVVAYIGTSLTLNIYLIGGSGTYSKWVFATSGIVREQISLGPDTFTLDNYNTGVDFGSSFGGMLSSADFKYDIPGTIWAHFDYTKFSDLNDILFDLHWVANGEIASTQVVRLTMNVWVVNANTTPDILTPTTTITTNLNILTTDTAKKKTSSDFITLLHTELSLDCDVILISITREADHVDDTYEGTFQLTDVVVKQ